MTTQNELLLEHRVSELELELHRLKRQLDKLTTAQTTPAVQAKGSGPAAPRTVLHQRVAYGFESKLPAIRRVIDFRSVNTHTNESLRVENFSVSQLTRACQQFSRLQSPNRRSGWKGKREIYGPVKKLFAQAGAVVQHPGSRTWSWCIWPHERRAVCARIVAALSPQK